MQNTQTRSAFVAIVGRPNVGKSSLLNAIIGEKVSIVSDKPQTTRTKITGVLTQKETQFVFIDTPGLHKPKNKLSDYMVKQAKESIGDVDVALLVVEPDLKIFNAEQELIESLIKNDMPTIAVINKIDLLKQKDEILSKIELLSHQMDFEAIIPVSAATKEGIDILVQELHKYTFEAPHFFPDDALTDQPERLIVAEIIREKILKNMRDEIPHGIAVSIEQMKERPEKEIIDIQALIYCERENHKGMIIGKSGSMLKLIASQAREEIEDFLNIKINLQCWVKVKEDWRNKENSIKNMGYN